MSQRRTDEGFHLGPLDVSHYHQQHAGRDELVARIRLQIARRQRGEGRLASFRIERVRVVLEQRRGREDANALVGVRVAGPRPAQELAARLRHRPLGERRMRHTVGEHAPGLVEIACQPGEAEHRPVHLRLERDDRARAGHRPAGRFVGELRCAVFGASQEQRFDPRRALGELPGAAQQVQPHRHDVAGPIDPLDHPQPGDLVGNCERVRRPRAAPRYAGGARGSAPEECEHGGAQDRRGTGAHGVILRVVLRSQAARASTTGGVANTPMTRGRETT